MDPVERLFRAARSGPPPAGPQEDGPLPVSEEFAAARWGCVSLPTLVIGDPAGLTTVLPRACHRPDSGDLAETMAKFFTTGTVRDEVIKEEHGALGLD